MYPIQLIKAERKTIPDIAHRTLTQDAYFKDHFWSFAAFELEYIAVPHSKYTLFMSKDLGEQKYQLIQQAYNRRHHAGGKALKLKVSLFHVRLNNTLSVNNRD